MTGTAVILARGLGSRMRRDDGTPHVGEQAAVVSGLKALVNIGRPFIDYLMSSLADAGVRRIVLVSGPEHLALREHCQTLMPTRIEIAHAIQMHPLGTANALQAVENVVGSEPFLMVNSDNYYPVTALKALSELSDPGLIGFAPSGLLRGNIREDRLDRFAYLETDEHHHLRRILEKPSPAEFAALPEPRTVSMNCWRFDRRIFAACAAIGPSTRGEYELTTAVQYGIDKLGIDWIVIPNDEPVWDLTGRRDIAPVSAALAKVPVRL